MSGFFGYGTVSLPVVVLCIPGFTGLTREARRGDADGDERSHAEARGRTRRVLVGGVTRPSRLRALRVRSRAPHVPKDSREGREEEMLTVMNDLTLEARRTRPGTGELPREAVRGLWEYQIPWSTTPGVPRWCDRPRVQPSGGELSCEGGRCPPRSREWQILSRRRKKRPSSMRLSGLSSQDCLPSRSGAGSDRGGGGLMTSPGHNDKPQFFAARLPVNRVAIYAVGTRAVSSRKSIATFSFCSARPFFVIE